MKEGVHGLSETRPYPGPFDGVYPERSRMGSGQASPVRDCAAISKSRVVIPNECEGSKKDFCLRSKQGFLAEPVLSAAEGLEMTSRGGRGFFAIAIQSPKGEGVWFWVTVTLEGM
jgi:hypothetical protein